MVGDYLLIYERKRLMTGKKLGTLLQEYDFKTIQDELLMEFKASKEQLDLCKELYTSLQEVEFVPSKLKYGIITTTNKSGIKTDQVIAHAEFMDEPLSIREMSPNDIVSALVDLDSADLETLFIALSLKSLTETIDEEEDPMMAVQIKPVSSDANDGISEKVYDEESLFPFKKKTQVDDHTS
jgi:hypothetical protein